MNDMFDNLKELKQKLELANEPKETAKKPVKSAQTAALKEDKEKRLQRELAEFLKDTVA